MLHTFSWLNTNRISGAAVALLCFHLISPPLPSPSLSSTTSSSSSSSFLPCAPKCNVNKTGLRFSHAAHVHNSFFVLFFLFAGFSRCLQLQNTCTCADHCLLSSLQLCKASGSEPECWAGQSIAGEMSNNVTVQVKWFLLCCKLKKD